MVVVVVEVVVVAVAVVVVAVAAGAILLVVARTTRLTETRLKHNIQHSLDGVERVPKS